MPSQYLVYNGIFDRIRKFYFKKVAAELKRLGAKDVLDYGCGPGDFLLEAKEMGLKASGCDKFERSVRLAKDRDLEVELGDETLLMREGRRFDAIVVQSVLEHVDEPVELVSRLVTLLRPGGILMLSCPTPSPDFWNDPTHRRPFTPKSFLTLAELANLRVLRCTYVFSYLLGMNLRSSFWYKSLNIIPASLGSNLIAFYKRYE